MIALGAGLAWWNGSQTPARSVAWGTHAATMRATSAIPADATRAPQPFAFDVATARAVVRVPELIGDTPQPFGIDEAMVRRAVHEGQLRIALSEGSTYPVRIEQQSKDAFGHWTVVGRVASALGSQAMVLTFGQGAVFGALPRPDGRMLQIATTRGVTTISTPGGVSLSTAVRPEAIAMAQPAALRASAAAGTTPVDIRVLGLYGDDIVALRGTEAAVQTEIANHLAVATQAHIDSGSRVRFTLAGTFAIHDTFAENAEALAWITDDADQEKGIFAKRNQFAADLVSLLRVRGAGDTNCGAANTTGANMTRNGTGAVGGVSDVNGYSVVDTTPCGPYTMAHQLGHNLGNADDRLAEMAPWGEQKHGAYPFSFGYVRETQFATIMSEPGALPVLGVYSNPALNTCMAGPCGIAGEADNVRSMNLIADEVAQFRGTPNTLSLADATAWEPANGATGVSANIPLRYSGQPTGTPQVSVRIIGGTAVAGVDYQMPPGGVMTTTLAPESFVSLSLLGDGVIDGDKTLLLQVQPVSGVTIERTTATLTLHDADPRAVLRGHVRFGDGVTPGTVIVKAFRANGNAIDDTGGYRTATAQAPDYAFAFPVVRGASVRLEMEGKATTDPNVNLWAHPVFANHVVADRWADVVVERTIPVNARLNDGRVPNLALMSRNWSLAGANDALLKRVLPGDRLRIQSTAAPDNYGQVVDEVTGPLGFIVAQSTGAVVYLDADVQSVGEGDAGTRDAVFDLRLSKAAPAPVQVYYRTLDGTAKAGSDYVGTSSASVTFPAGSTLQRIRVPVMGDRTPEHGERFEVQILSVVGATSGSTRLHMTIADDDRRTGGPGPKTVAH